MDSKRARSSDYGGYKVARGKKTEIDVVDMKKGTLNGNPADISKEWFWAHYVRKRRPVLLKNAPSLDLDAFSWENIGRTLDGDDELQVEELVKGGFGSGKKRLQMTFAEFKKRVDKGECLYMTTQYDDEKKEDGEEALDGDFHDDFDDEEEGVELPEDFEDDFEEDQDEGPEEPVVDLEDIYQPPLDFLVLEDNTDILKPIPLPILEGYTPQQINLWIGNSHETTLEVFQQEGAVENVNKGLPSKATSSGLHHDHADNLYTLVEGSKSFSLWSPNHAHDLYTIGDVRTVYDTGIIDYIRNERAPNWSSLNERGMVMGEEAPTVPTELDPPSFSKIPPSLLHLDEVDESLRPQMEAYLASKFPLAKDVAGAGIRVHLNAGDCLYLPAGWFHEVSSAGKHVAINHWFHIPNLEL